MNILAQSTDLPAVPGDTLKWVLVIMVAILLIAVAVYSAFGLKRVRLDTDPPPAFRKASPEFNPALCDELHSQVARRLDGHDAAIEALRAEAVKGDKELEAKLEEFRLEAKRTESGLHRKLNGISRNLYLVAGKLGCKTVPNSDEEEP